MLITTYAEREDMVLSPRNFDLYYRLISISIRSVKLPTHVKRLESLQNTDPKVHGDEYARLQAMLNLWSLYLMNCTK